VPYPKPHLTFFGRTDALSKRYSSFDRVRDGLVWLAEPAVPMASQGMEFRCGSWRRDGGNRMARKDTEYLATESMHLKSCQGYSLSYKPTISLPFWLSRMPVITISGVEIDKTSSWILSYGSKGASHFPPFKMLCPSQWRKE
jgi:hypothetical protein